MKSDDRFSARRGKTETANEATNGMVKRVHDSAHGRVRRDDRGGRTQQLVDTRHKRRATHRERRASSKHG